jgi:5'-nucleotidase
MHSCRGKSSAYRFEIYLLVLTSLSIFPQATTAADLVRITLLQLNDVYQIMPVDDGKRGGMARVGTMVKKIRQESPNTLFLLAGDTISPSVASTIFKGRQMITAWNLVGLDYATFGNHEFDFGDEVLRQRMKESRFVWLAANVVNKDTGELFDPAIPYIIRDAGGVKLGIIGLVTEDTPANSKPGPLWEFLPPLETASRLVPQMRQRGAQIIVAVTHLNMREDKRLARSADIDLILGGHEHTLLQSLSGKTPILKWGSDARDLGRIDLMVRIPDGKIESMDWAALPVDSTVPEDPEVASPLAEFEKTLSAELDRPIGKTSVQLEARQSILRNRETNLGNLLADIFRRKMQADVAMLNSGSVRSNRTYGPGMLTRRDVLSMLPFENHLVKVEISGGVLRQALEHGLSRIAAGSEAGRFPLISGMQIFYDSRRPAGHRLSRILIQGTPLEEGGKYSLATNSYLTEGGDGYRMLMNLHYLVTPLEGPVVPDAVMSAILSAREIAPQVEGRIQERIESSP